MPRFRLHRDPTARASDPYVLMTADGKILAGGKGDDRQPVEVDPESVAPLVEARAEELAKARVAASAPVGSAAWLGGLDAEAKASFEAMTAAGVPTDKAARTATLPADLRSMYESDLIDGAKAAAARREAGYEAKADEILSSGDVRGVVVPAARADWRNALVAAARHDAGNPPAQGQPGMVDSIRAALAKQPPHQFTGPMVVTNADLPAGSKVLDDFPGRYDPVKAAQEQNREYFAARGQKPDGDPERLAAHIASGVGGWPY